MISFLGIILFLFLALMLFASSLVISVVKWVLSLFGLCEPGRWSVNVDRRSTGGQDAAGRTSGASRSSSSSSSSGWHYSAEALMKKRKRKKIIQPDEGEYVDFEEVK